MSKEKSFRMMKTEEFEDSIYYRAACDCGSKDHDILIEIELDKKIPDVVFLNFYKDVCWCSNWGNLNFFQRWIKKIKAVFRMIFTGYIELEESFIFRGEEHIKEFIEGLNEALRKIQDKKSI